MIDTETALKRLVTFLNYALISAGVLLITVDVAISARDAFGLVGGGIALILAGFVLAGVLRAAQSIMGK